MTPAVFNRANWVRLTPRDTAAVPRKTPQVGALSLEMIAIGDTGCIQYPLCVFSRARATTRGKTSLATATEGGLGLIAQ